MFPAVHFSTDCFEAELLCACVCSFLDDAFRKNLESALRFGNPLLVQDVESYDPILNPVLNRELRRTGGRVLITLGDQDIDLSPSFTIFLSTRDPTVMMTATFVKCLISVLKGEIEVITFAGCPLSENFTIGMFFILVSGGHTTNKSHFEFTEFGVFV